MPDRLWHRKEWHWQIGNSNKLQIVILVKLCYVMNTWNHNAWVSSSCSGSDVAILCDHVHGLELWVECYKEVGDPLQESKELLSEQIISRNPAARRLSRSSGLWMRASRSISIPYMKSTTAASTWGRHPFTSIEFSPAPTSVSRAVLKYSDLRRRSRN